MSVTVNTYTSGKVKTLSRYSRIGLEMILVLGYWILGNTHRYWLGSIGIGGYFLLFWHPIQYQSDNSQHCPHASNNYLVPLVTCTLTVVVVCLDTTLLRCCLINTIIAIIIEFWDFLWSLLCNTLISAFVLGIGIAGGQYYWVLDIGCLSWYRSNPKIS